MSRSNNGSNTGAKQRNDLASMITKYRCPQAIAQRLLSATKRAAELVGKENVTPILSQYRSNARKLQLSAARQYGISMERKPDKAVGRHIEPMPLDWHDVIRELDLAWKDFWSFRLEPEKWLPPDVLKAARTGKKVDTNYESTLAPHNAQQKAIQQFAANRAATRWAGDNRDARIGEMVHMVQADLEAEYSQEELSKLGYGEVAVRRWLKDAGVVPKSASRGGRPRKK